MAQEGTSTYSSPALTVSVALCSYNGGSFLREQLASIAAQSRPPDEVVICDDGSTDGSVPLLHQFAGQAPFPVLVQQNPQRLGPNANFEQALRLCSGEIIFLADQDDVWMPEKIAVTLQEFAADQQAGLVFSDGEVVDGAGQPRGYTLWRSFGFTPAQQRLVNRGQALDVLLKRNVVTGAAAAFRACYKNLVLPFPNVGVHDGWIALLIAGVAKVRAVEQPLIRYRHHGRNQVGAAQRTAAHGVGIALKPGAKVYADQSEQARLAAARLENWPQSENIQEAKLRLQQRAEFASYRAFLPESRLARLPAVLSRLLTGGYSRFTGRGWRSAAVDLVRPG